MAPKHRSYNSICSLANGALCLVAAVLTLHVSAFSQTQTPAAGDYNDSYDNGYGKLTELERRGRDTWYFWTGGGQSLWRKLAAVTNGANDLLFYVDSRQNGHRFRDLGIITQPGCKPATAPDEYGLWFDDCAKAGTPDMPGEPSGVLGLRKFPNPKFDKAKWSVEKYRADPKNIEPPFMIGMACGFCHNAFNPLDPPADPEHPLWRNIVGAFGNQYFEEGKFFTTNLKPDDFRWHVGNRQPPGTSDTSRVATDHIFNPNAINPIFNLADRPTKEEKLHDGSTLRVHHILKDGADSIGVAGASLRVYVNIGMCSDYWLTLHDPVVGTGTQKPFLVEKARAECADWRATEERMPAAEAFLKTIGPMHLKDAPGANIYLTASADLLNRGKIVYAEQCARCHSSKRPPSDLTRGSPAEIEWFRKSVQAEDFLDHNFLSDDERYSVAEIGTNIARAVGSNATHGHVWDNFSSETYKELPVVGPIKGLYNPLKPSDPITFKVEGGGRGYYRTPSLVSIWASAPFFHNNGLGAFIKDPSVAARVTAYEDAMEKMLWPEKRLGAQTIMVTSVASKVARSDGTVLDVPAGMPVKILASVDPNQIRSQPAWITRLLSKLFGGKLIWNTLLDKNLAPDFIEDRGHTFGSDLSDADKRALIEFVKTF